MAADSKNVIARSDIGKANMTCHDLVMQNELCRWFCPVDGKAHDLNLIKLHENTFVCWPLVGPQQVKQTVIVHLIAMI